MSGNNMVAQGIEKHGVRTFSTQEMAFNILGLMHPRIAQISQHQPLWADLNGGLQFINDLQQLSQRLRVELQEHSQIRKAVSADNALDYAIVNGTARDKLPGAIRVTPRANMKFQFPELKPYQAFDKLSDLRGMVDLEKVVVVVGFGEVGPWGNSRTRWEMEAYGTFSLEGCIEMAWMMGFIKHFNGPLKTGTLYTGWVDAQTNEPVEDVKVKSKYEDKILTHTGIRLVGMHC
jgi:fatty acid synthase subunit beta